MDLADCGSYCSFDHTAGNTPTLHELLNFPGQQKKINIPQEIGTQYKIFGTILLEDDSGKRVDNIVHEYREESRAYQHRNPPGVADWTRQAASYLGNPCGGLTRH